VEHLHVHAFGGTQVEEFIAQSLHHVVNIRRDVKRHNDVGQPPQTGRGALHVLLGALGLCNVRARIVVTRRQ
jgi:hypothetical protein